MMKEERVTVFLVTYNQENFVKEAAESILNQDYKNLDIVISDDCSTDNTYDILKELVGQYKGKHNVYLRKNEKNMGVVEHINLIINKFLKTEYYIPCSGDDIQYPNRVKEVMNYFKLNQDVYAVCSNAVIIDEAGKEHGIFLKKFPLTKRDFFEVMKKGSNFFGAGAAYRKDIFDNFGIMNSNARNEDQILPYRASLLGKVGYINKPLLKYRVHDNNLSYWIKKKGSVYKEFISLEIKDYENQIINLKNLLEDIKKIGNTKAFKYVDNNIELLEFNVNLLKRSFLSRAIYSIMNAKFFFHKKGFKKRMALAFSPYIMYIKERNS